MEPREWFSAVGIRGVDEVGSVTDICKIVGFGVCGNVVVRDDPVDDC